MPTEFEVGRVHLGPDDCLVIKIRKRLSREQLDDFRSVIEDQLGLRSRDRVLIIDDSVDISVLSGVGDSGMSLGTAWGTAALTDTRRLTAPGEAPMVRSEGGNYVIDQAVERAEPAVAEAEGPSPAVREGAGREDP